MNKRFNSLFRILWLAVWLALLSNTSGYGFERKQPVSLPPCAVDHSQGWDKGEPWFCVIQYDTAPPAYYFDQFEAGDGIAVYMDPSTCGFGETYPFKITNIHTYLHGPEVFEWPVEIKVSILNVDTLIDTLGEIPDTLTPVPGRAQYSQVFTIYQDSAYDPANPGEPLNLALDGVVCINAAFFLEIIYTGGTQPLYPGLVMAEASDLPDINRNWVLWKRYYYEWYDFWETAITPGRAIMRVTGYPYAIDCDQLCWSWMPEAFKAPNGMPDFDQYQFGPDTVAMSGPATMANLLVWLNLIPSITDPDSLIRLLSHHFRTDPTADGGTLIDSVKFGLDSLFTDYGLSYLDTVFERPTFSAMADSVKNSIGTALLVGLWQKIGDNWYRIGGHYVGMAGACKKDFWVALSDPALDNAEAGGRGRFLPPHQPHPEDYTLHNTRGFVSHDAYLSDTLSDGPMAGAWILRDLLADSLPWCSQFEGLNFQPDQQQFAHSYDPAEVSYAVVEYAIIILEKPTLAEEEEAATPGSFVLFQSYPNPFNNQTVIKYSLPEPTKVSLVIYNVLGQRVKTLVKETRQSGLFNLTWDGKDEDGVDLSSGIYFYRLQAGEWSLTKRMVLLK